MIDFTVSDISQILNGKWFNPKNLPDFTVRQIVTDSRLFYKKQDSLFFALSGPRNNGHLYISELIKKGITAFVVSDKSICKRQGTFYSC